jgi:hypothetical protein
VATAKTSGLNVRALPSTDAELIDQVAKGEELIVLDSKVFTDDKEHGKWVKVSLDSDDSADGTVAYVAKEYVDLSFELIKAVSIEELKYGTGVSSVRVKLVDLAKNYLGDRYVCGGTTLGVGVDCSGYVQALYRKLGYYIPRDSRSQARGGIAISGNNLNPVTWYSMVALLYQSCCYVYR